MEFARYLQNVNNRYAVRLTWKHEVNLEDNYYLAHKRLLHLTKRLQKDTTLLERYDKAIREYSSSGVAEKVKAGQSNGEFVYYMPHQAAIREDRTTTKIRIVFDASSAETHGTSVNNCLDAGPNLNPDLVSVLLNFTTHKVALVADEKQAFLEILIQEEDRDALRMLWWEHIPYTTENNKLETWRMTRVTFGIASSTFLLAATIKAHLQSVKDKYPDTVRMLEKSVYVDDVIIGGSSDEDARKVYLEAGEIFSTADMELRKWTSSSKDLHYLHYLKELFASYFEEEGPDRQVREIGQINVVLGLNWNFEKDEIDISAENSVKDMNEDSLCTKRMVLQRVARIYDPLGMLAPVIVAAKMLLQSLWKTKISWDDHLQKDQQERWLEWCTDVEELQKITMSRCYDVHGCT
ncbi:uncharacterized protein LOC135388617 [Ornithodoros turicata]|uniref:uncharacterized protein LOC135388617 n=1 Tax=Ornithodoros turicata TaxID=34597 RepID=UPI0031386E1C